MMLPTIHNNGTSPERLYADLELAAAKMRETIKALEAAAPNGRDYYPQGPGAHGQAIDEHNARVAKIHWILKEIGEMMEHVADHM